MSDNPRVEIGNNSSTAHDVELRRIVKELNECRRDRKAIGDEEKEVKDELKALGINPRMQAIARRALKSKQQDPEEVLERALELVTGTEYEASRTRFEALALDRSVIAKRERKLREEAREKGIEVKALPIVRAMQDMDSQERIEFFDGIVAQCSALRFW